MNSDCACVICGEEADEPFTTLACGHSFHVDCILKWFRYENTTCPMCRSEYSDRMMVHVPVRTRITMMRRRRQTLPVGIRKTLDCLDRCVARSKQASRDLHSFRRIHREVFKEWRKLARKEARHACKREEMENGLLETCVPQVPLMEPQSDSESSES